MSHISTCHHQLWRWHVKIGMQSRVIYSQIVWFLFKLFICLTKRNKKQLMPAIHLPRRWQSDRNRNTKKTERRENMSKNVYGIDAHCKNWNRTNALCITLLLSASSIFSLAHSHCLSLSLCVITVESSEQGKGLQLPIILCYVCLYIILI